MRPIFILHLATLGLKHAVLFKTLTAAGDSKIASCCPSTHFSNRRILDNADCMRETSLLIALGTKSEGRGYDRAE